MTTGTVPPLSPEEETELRRTIPGNPHETLDAGAWYSPETMSRVLATLDAERRMADTEVTALREGLDAARTPRETPSREAEAYAAGRLAGFEEGLGAPRETPDLGGLRALSENATAGPWSFEGLTEDGWALLGNTPEPVEGEPIPEKPYGYGEGVTWERADAAFVAAAVNYVRGLLDD